VEEVEAVEVAVEDQTQHGARQEHRIVHDETVEASPVLIEHVG
jgi:hypothetical protein